MKDSEKTSKPQVKVSKAGVRQVSPAEILKSAEGRDQIRKTARSVKVKKTERSSADEQ